METMPPGWIRFGALTPWQRLTLSGWVLMPFLFIPLMFGANLLFSVGFRRGGYWGVVASLLVVALVNVARIVVHSARHPAPWVNLEMNELRSGTKTVPLASIDNAVLVAAGSAKFASLVLQLRSGKTTITNVYIRQRSTIVLSERDRPVFAETLRRTAIAMPCNPDDPKGRFSRYNFPGHVDKETAIDLVLNTPKAGEPLPIST